MSRLIKNEFKKIFGKKTIYILFIVAIGFIIITNLLCNMDSDYDQTEYLKEELEYCQKQLESINKNSKEENSYYIDFKTRYDILALKLSYESDSWQNNFIDSSDIVYETIQDLNENTYGLEKDSTQLKKAQAKYKQMKESLDSNDWKSFVTEQLQQTKEEIAFYEEQLKNIHDKATIEAIQASIETEKIKQQALEWRLEKNINYDGGFLSGKVEEYTYSAQSVQSLSGKEYKTREEEQEYTSSLKQMNISKYYIENNIQIEKENDARNILINLTTEYGIFIIIFSIIIAGTIVSNEFQKGTIKLLLTRPFPRNKILLSKYIVSILCIILFITLFAIAQYIIGGFVFGFNVYQIPAIEYNATTNSVVTMPILSYVLLRVLAALPMYVLLATLAFALSTITMNSAIAVAIPILGNMVAEGINIFIERIKILKYFVTANWDLTVYLFGGKGIAEGLNLPLSLVIDCIYLAIMLVASFIVFHKRDIKNI